MQLLRRGEFAVDEVWRAERLAGGGALEAHSGACVAIEVHSR